MSPDPVHISQALGDLARGQGWSDKIAWYEAGLDHGIALGRRQVEDEHRGQHEVSAAIARQIAQMGPYAERAERRGQPERAARQRQILQERGIA